MNNAKFNINDIIYCAQNIEIADNNKLDIITNKYKLNYIIRFSKNKSYKIQNIKYKSKYK